MTDWAEFTLAMGVFLGSHSLPRLGGARERLIDQFGRRSYFAVYGLLSTGLLVWLIIAAGRAPFVEIWPQEVWMRWIPNLLVPFALWLTVMGMGVKNPSTLGGARDATHDPKSAGIEVVSRHPLLLALFLWAAAHLLANGDLAHVLLFGSFAAFPLLAMWGFDRKDLRLRGDVARDLQATTGWFSLKPFFQVSWWRGNAKTVAIRSGITFVLWQGALHLHAPVIGVWPFP